MPDRSTPTDDTRRSYDAVAERYAAEVSYELAGKPLDRALLDAFAELAADGPVLDVGCGPGHTAGRLAGRGVTAFGLDLSPGMCAVARAATSLPYAVADMTALPVRTGAAAGVLCLYAVIHLDEPRRAAAYAEFARVLRPGGHALVAFHNSSAEVRTGQEVTASDWWGHPVALTFRYLDPVAETTALAGAGLQVTARLDRAPQPGVEHQSRRSYLLARRAG
ncbi:class I SAM-dependent methyltransferase [Catellatospora sp. KI3]|uniref:class I SAM-dependent methyltransferase n=1 Tax=Catellatospora sp. KI3 TaxID=3041620 RepID=UPI0024832B2F|nr:class I SAM-dependent methyltransferase [Catellatospora sp. KI3]MDI1465196.1 class I SAM-dependent methyltransferase [Catellatospora sp. KI3]